MCAYCTADKLADEANRTLTPEQKLRLLASLTEQLKTDLRG